MIGAGCGMGRLSAALFLSYLLCFPGVLAQCSKQDYQYCVKLADPLLKDPHLIYPDNARDIEHVCRTWSFFVDCVKQYTDRCFTEIKRQEFNRAVENPVNSIHKLCSMPDYRNDYMKHAPCMKMTLTQDSHCGRHYRHLVAQVSGEAPRASICCSHHLFRECVLDHTRNSCDADAAPFSAQMLDKALSFLKDQCNNYVPNRVDCPGSDFYQTGRTELSTLEGELPSPTVSGTATTRVFGSIGPTPGIGGSTGSVNAGGMGGGMRGNMGGHGGNMGGPGGNIGHAGNMGGPGGSIGHGGNMGGPGGNIGHGGNMGGPGGNMGGPGGNIGHGGNMGGPGGNMGGPGGNIGHGGNMGGPGGITGGPGGNMGGFGGTTMDGNSAIPGGSTSVTVQMSPPRTSPQPSWMSPSTDSRGVPTSNTPDWRQQESTMSSGAASTGSGGWMPGGGRGRTTVEAGSEPTMSSSSGYSADSTSRVSYGRGITWPSTERDQSASSPIRPAAPDPTWIPSSRPIDAMMKENAIDEPNQQGLGSEDNSASARPIFLSLFLLASSLLLQALFSR